MEDKKIKRIAFAACIVVSVSYIFLYRAGYLPDLWALPPAQAAPATPMTHPPILLPPGEKLKEANWHCYAGGTCQLWTLTKPRKADEKPETYNYTSADGTDKYVIKEQ